MRFLFSVCVFLNACWLQAQLGGDATFRFLELSSSPRALALADPVTLEDNDISTALSNPALIRATHGGQVMVTYEPYFDGIHRGGGAYTYTLNRKSALAFDVNYINYGTFSGADEFGNPTSDFSGNEVAIGVGSSYYMLAANLHVGGRLRYIRSTLESYSSSGISADMGLYYAPIGSSWRFGLVFQHLGKQLTPQTPLLANNFRLGFFIVLNNFKYSSVACNGACTALYGTYKKNEVFLFRSINETDSLVIASV